MDTCDYVCCSMDIALTNFFTISRTINRSPSEFKATHEKMNLDLSWDNFFRGLSENWIFPFHPKCHLCWWGHSGVRVFVSFHHYHRGGGHCAYAKFHCLYARPECTACIHYSVSFRNRIEAASLWEVEGNKPFMIKRQKVKRVALCTSPCLPQSTAQVLHQGPSNAPLHCACVVHGVSTVNARTNEFRTPCSDKLQNSKKWTALSPCNVTTYTETERKFVHQITWVNPFAGSGSSFMHYITTRRCTNLNYELSFTIRSTDSYPPHTIANGAYVVLGEIN